MSYCSCDYDAPEFWVATIRRARKQHRCDECFKPIMPGEQYEAVAAFGDGGFYAPKTCEWIYPAVDARVEINLTELAKHLADAV